MKRSLGIEFLLEHIEALIMYTAIQHKISKESTVNYSFEPWYKRFPYFLIMSGYI